MHVLPIPSGRFDRLDWWTRYACPIARLDSNKRACTDVTTHGCAIDCVIDASKRHHAYINGVTIIVSRATVRIIWYILYSRETSAVSAL